VLGSRVPIARPLPDEEASADADVPAKKRRS